MNDLYLSGIYIYPVKSMQGISLESVRTEDKGFPFDRRWMLVDEAGRFLSQRRLPELATFSVRIDGDQLIVSHKGDDLTIPVKTETRGNIKVRLHKSRFHAPIADQKYNNWLSAHLGMPCFLIVTDNTVERTVSEKYSLNNDPVSFADGFPYLIIGESSLQDLNSRMISHLPMNRFRPNIVFSGGDPFTEDGWDTFRIGNALFKSVKPCGRCVVTTIDQTTGEKGEEPLMTLAGYRKFRNKLIFGHNLLCLEHGLLHIGDKINVLSRK